MTELVARASLPRAAALHAASRAGAAALALGVLALGLVQALDASGVSFALALAGGVALIGFLLLTIRHYDTAIALSLLLMGGVRFEPAPPDLAFGVIMCVAAVPGRFRLSRVPPLLRWIVALLLFVNLASMTDLVTRCAAARLLVVTSDL